MSDGVEAGANHQSRVWRIGPWTFAEDSNELRHDSGEFRRLEDRASRALALLASRRGETVRRQDLIEAVWNGRSLSENSVAVVISDLRKALGDNPKDAKYIETVPKRGYRLNGRDAASETAGAAKQPSGFGRRAPTFAIVAIAVATAAVVFIAAWITADSSSRTPATIVTINNVQNQTGEPAYDALAASLTELGASYLASSTGAALLVRDRWDFDADDPSRGLYEDFGRDARVFHITTRIVMDNGAPTVTMFANNPRTNEVLWTTAFPAPEGPLGPVLQAELDKFLAKAAP